MATNVTDKLLGLSPRITLPPHIDPNDFHAVSEYVVPRAIAREIYRHKMAGNRIVVERGGEVVYLEPDEIVVDEALLRDPSDPPGRWSDSPRDSGGSNASAGQTNPRDPGPIELGD